MKKSTATANSKLSMYQMFVAPKGETKLKLKWDGIMVGKRLMGMENETKRVGLNCCNCKRLTEVVSKSIPADVRGVTSEFF